MIVQVKKKNALSIQYLLRAVLKFVYDEKNMSVVDIREMKESIITWDKAINIEEEKLAQTQAADVKVFGRKLTTSHKYSEEQIILQRLAKLLVENEGGKLDNRKRLFKEKGIDYRKFHRLPEAFEPKDFVKARIDKAKYDAKNPEQEGIR